MLSLSTVATTAAVTGATAVAGLALYHLHLSRRRKHEAPVRWSWLPWLGYALEMGQRPLELLCESAAQCGEIFGLVVAGNRLFIITDPHSHHLIFTKNKDLSWEEFHNTVSTNFFGADPKVLDKYPGHDDTQVDKHDDLMRSWYSKHLFSDTALQGLTTRMQVHLNDHLVPALADGVHHMYDVIGRLVFDAAVASLFSEAAGADSTLYPAFSVFDSFLPLAVAGIPIKHLRNGKEARDHLYKAIHQYKEGVSDLIDKRWAHFHSLVDQVQRRHSPAHCPSGAA